MTFKAPIVAGMGFVVVFLSVLLACLALVTLIPSSPTTEPIDITSVNGLFLATVPLSFASLGVLTGQSLLRIASDTDQRSLWYRSIGKWYIRLSLLAGGMWIISALILLRQGATP